MKGVAYFFFALFIIFMVGLVFRACNVAGSYADVAAEQLNTREVLRKYEWFKDASAQLDKKQADLKNYEQRFTTLKESYGKDSTNRSKWTRSDVETYNLWQFEYLGVKSSYNDLAAQYNAAMAKINYRFCNVGYLPQGATEPLPREFKPYQ